jgi:predicted nucleic acid-binding Zn finger protein
MKKKVTFVIPNTRWFNLRYWNLFPYIIGLLVAVIKDKYNIKVIDAKIELYADIITDLKKVKVHYE